MQRTIVTIDEDKCTGCGECVDACHEAAIALVNGKARLVRDDYCDGLGSCLPVCPTGAISFAKGTQEDRRKQGDRRRQRDAEAKRVGAGADSPIPTGEAASELHQWPIQIKLIATSAPYLEGTDLLIAADCASYAYANFHADFMQRRKILVGCPKLDNIDYSDKLTSILAENNIASVTVARMEVPCCGGIEHAARTAIQRSGKPIPFEVVTLSITGEVL
jgi:NAD-dependent dihydropyrimidine dehydrogenase PreA subunit